jgi:hypothetical protein
MIGLQTFLFALLWRARKLFVLAGRDTRGTGTPFVIQASPLCYPAIERTKRCCSSEICPAISSPCLVPYVPVDLSSSEADRSPQLCSLLVSDLAMRKPRLGEGD